MANIIAEVQPTEFDFTVFDGDDFLWERFLKDIDKEGVEIAIPLAGYTAVFSVVDSSDVSVFSINTAGGGYPTNDGILLGTLDGQVTLYKQGVTGAGVHTYCLKITVPDTNGTTVTIIYGKFTILENDC